MTNNKLHKPHDAIAKQWLSRLDVARDFLNAHLPPSIRNHCDLNTLKIEPSSFVEEDLKQLFSDLIYSLKINQHTSYIYLLLEHQSSPEALLPFRLLRYQVALLQRFYDQGCKTLPIVIPMVIYHGEKSPYPYATQLANCFVDPTLASDAMFKQIHLIDLTIIEDTSILQHERAALLEMIQRHIFSRDIMIHLPFIKKALVIASHYPDLHEPVKSMLYYLIKTADYPDGSTFIHELINDHSPYQEDIMTIAEQLKQIGREEGMKKGMENGLNLAREEIIQKMLAAGLSKEMIEKILGSQ